MWQWPWNWVMVETKRLGIFNRKKPTFLWREFWEENVNAILVRTEEEKRRAGEKAFQCLREHTHLHKWNTDKTFTGVLSHCGSAVMNPTSIREDGASIPGLTQWVKDPALLWAWCRVAAAALIHLLAWESPYAMGVALKSKKEEREREKEGRKEGKKGKARKQGRKKEGHYR